MVSKRSAEIIPLDSKKFRCLRKPLGRSGAGEFRFPARVANRPTVHCCCGTHFARRCPRSWGTKGAAQQSVDGPSDCGSPTRTESSVAQASRNFSKNRVDVSAGNAPPRRWVCKTSCLSIVMASSYLAMFDHDQPNLPRRRGGAASIWRSFVGRMVRFAPIAAMPIRERITTLARKSTRPV